MNFHKQNSNSSRHSGTNKTIIITGTHHTPAQELITTLKKDKTNTWNIHYIGRKHNFQNQKVLSVEYQIIPKLGVKFHAITSGRFNRRSPAHTIAGLKSSFENFKKTYQLIKKIKPHIVVSFGGYISVPVIISSWMQKIPSITHEQTTTISLSTKLNSFFVKKVALSFPDRSLPPKKVVITGNLLRSEIFQTHPGPFALFQQRPKNKALLYITGGNQGASFINQNILKILPHLLVDFAIIHQTGNKDYKNIVKKTKDFSSNLYHPTPFVSAKHIGWIFKNSDLIISRSGANISQEIATFQKKALLIPLPNSQNQEQEKNALWAQKYAPITILQQSSIKNPQGFLSAIQNLRLSKINHTYPKLNFNTSSKKLLHLIQSLSL